MPEPFARWWIHTSVLLAAVLCFMAIAAWTAAPWWEYAFLSDGSAVSWLSSALLFANGAVALRLTLDGSLPRLFGSLVTVALVALALDEEFLLHERIKEASPAPVADWPTWTVTLGAICFAWVVRRTFKAGAARGLIHTAVGVGIFALWVDLGSPPAAVARLEEAYEVIAETVFLCGLLAVSRDQVQSAS